MEKHNVVVVRRYKRSDYYRNAKSLVQHIQKLRPHSEILDTEGHPAEAGISVPIFHGKVTIMVFPDKYLVGLYFYSEDKNKHNKIFQGTKHLIELADNFYFY